MLNLVVESPSRGAGVGQALMAAASKLAAGHWAAERMYVHVDSQNQVCALRSKFILPIFRAQYDVLERQSWATLYHMLYLYGRRMLFKRLHSCA